MKVKIMPEIDELMTVGMKYIARNTEVPLIF